MRFIIAGILLGALAISAYAYDDGDFQVWNTEVEEFKINKDTKLVLEEEFRWGDNAKEFYYQHYDLGLFYNLKKYLNLGFGYRQVYELRKGKFQPENEPYLTATLFWELLKFKFEDRSRLEYRHFDYQADSARYRNKFSVKLPCKFAGVEFQPYLSDEIFAGFGGTNQFNQNRFSCGLGTDLTKNLKADIYYMLQTTKSSGRWKDANVLGTKLKLVF